MFIDTTLHLHTDTIIKISRASRRGGRSMNYFVSRLLCIIADEELVKPMAWSRIRYQNRDHKSNWHRIHVSFSPAEYELLLDLRKVYKMSGSRIIALAVDKYIDGLQDSSPKGSDNYRFSCYVFSRFIMDGVICWAQYWGLPGKLHAFPALPFPIKNQVPTRGS